MLRMGVREDGMRGGVRGEYRFDRTGINGSNVQNVCIFENCPFTPVRVCTHVSLPFSLADMARWGCAVSGRKPGNDICCRWYVCSEGCVCKC